MSTFNLNLNRTFRERKVTKVWNNEEDDEEEYCDCNKSYLSSFYASMGSLMEVIRLPPLINKCVNISSQRFLSTLSDGNRHRLNLAIHSISNFIYTDIMNRFGLFEERVYCISTTGIKPYSEENDEFLCYYLQMKGVMSHEKLNVCSDNNQIVIKGAVHDEFKATHHICCCFIYLQPEDSWYLKYNTRDIKADFSKGEGGA